MDDVSLADGSEGGRGGKGGSNTGVGGKGKEIEVVEAGEIQTKVSTFVIRLSCTSKLMDHQIDFRDLPVETLYKYLEHNDLLPRWAVSPWSEEPCVPRRSFIKSSAPDPV